MGGAGAGELFGRTQVTPNPLSLMFIPGPEVLGEGVKADEKLVRGSPLLKRVLRVGGVRDVFLGSDFVTVTKEEAADWAALKPQVFAAITDFYASGEGVLPEGSEAEAAGGELDDVDDEEDEIIAMIKELLDTRVRPAVQDDGGDLKFVSFCHETGLVTLQMQGACSGCPSSSVTLKSGVENMLMHYIPEVKEVVAQEEADGEPAVVGGVPKNPMEDFLSK